MGALTTKRQSAAYWRAQGRAFSPDANLPDVGGAVVEGPFLHPSTEPEVIADTQRCDVATCLKAHGWLSVGVGVVEIAAISAEVILCGWIVRRRLVELGYSPAPPEPKPPPRGGKRTERNRMCLPGGK